MTKLLAAIFGVKIASKSQENELLGLILLTTALSVAGAVILAFLFNRIKAKRKSETGAAKGAEEVPGG